MYSRDLLIILIDITTDGDTRPRHALAAWDKGPQGNAACIEQRDVLLADFTRDCVHRISEAVPGPWPLVQAIDFANTVMAGALDSPVFALAADAAERPRERHWVRQALRASLALHYTDDRDYGVGVMKRVKQAMDTHALSPDS